MLGLVEYYLETGKPVGSNTLKEAGFGDLSSATIRNYFAKLEEAGYLRQLHASGGRVPTELAYKLYANEVQENRDISAKNAERLNLRRNVETREISVYLQQCAEELSRLTNTAVFLSAPRFDHDFVLDVKLLGLDINRFLCVVITDFGVIRTEVIHTELKLNSFAIKRMEAYFHWRLTGHDKPEHLEPGEEETAQKCYNEVMLRYIVGYSHFVDEDLYRTGFSRLLVHPDFENPLTLANSLALFEHTQSLRLLLRECAKVNILRVWIGGDLLPYMSSQPQCAVMAAPYMINKKPVGAIGLLSPMRIPYKEVCGILRNLSESMSEALTQNIYKYKISFREPQPEAVYLQQEKQRILGQSYLILLEDKS